MSDYNEIIGFWVDEIGPQGWYNGPLELDDTIRDKFMADWEVARDGGYMDWKQTANGCLGYLILTDQFPRNMFREDSRAFVTDPLARAVANHAIDADFDLAIGPPAQQFFYLPFEHSETITDQERSVSLISTRMPEENAILHARVHQEIIRQFDRFPYRNKALGRVSTASEQEFLDNVGYKGVLQEIQRNTDIS
jgi:uncharacterized protein (DUF924 family)